MTIGAFEPLAARIVPVPQTKTAATNRFTAKSPIRFFIFELLTGDYVKELSVRTARLVTE
jgi:hypothetical protein